MGPREVSVLGRGQGCSDRQRLEVDSQMAVHPTGKVDQTHQTPAGDAACVKELTGRRLDFVPDVLGRLPVSCLWVPKGCPAIGESFAAPVETSGD